MLKFLERCIVHCNLDLKPPPSCSFVGFHFRNPIQGWERWDSTQDLRPLDESNKQKTGLGWGRMGGSSHLAFIFPQFQDHPTKTQQGTWFIVRRKDKYRGRDKREIITGRNSNALALSISPVQPCMPGGPQMAQSDPVRRIYLKTKYAWGFLPIFLPFSLIFWHIWMKRRKWNSSSLVPQIIENPLTDGWKDRRVASEVCFCMLFLGGTLFWVVCVMIGGEAMKGGPAKHF